MFRVAVPLVLHNEVNFFFVEEGFLLVVMTGVGGGGEHWFAVY